MIDEKVKTRNALTENLYELVEQRLQKAADYSAAQTILRLLFSGLDCTIEESLDEMTLCLPLEHGECTFNLYRSDETGYMFNLSPPVSNQDIETQISKTRQWIAHIQVTGTSRLFSITKM